MNNNINFGYNAEVNDNINSMLEKAKKRKHIANTYLQLNQWCMKTEDIVRDCETRGDSRTGEKLKDVLVPIKTALTDAIDKQFPNMNYKLKEYTTYKLEADTYEKECPEDSDNWLIWMRDSLEPESPDEADDISKSTGFQINTTFDDKSKVKQSKLLELYSPNRWSPLGLDSLGGMDELKAEIKDKLIFPIKNPEIARIDEIEYGKRYPRGILLYGPPGCGKTFTVEALAQELQLPLYKLKVGKAGSCYINQTSNNYEEAFDFAANMAKEKGSPVLLFIDEMDGLTGSRDKDSSTEDLKQVGTLLNLIETARDRNIVVIGATNKYDIVDDAIKARFDSQIYVGLPDEKTRAEVLRVSLSSRTKGHKLANSHRELEKVASITKDFPNRALCILTDKAALVARADGRRDIKAEDYINVVADNQNLKIKETKYQAKDQRKPIGFSRTV